MRWPHRERTRAREAAARRSTFSRFSDYRPAGRSGSQQSGASRDPVFTHDDSIGVATLSLAFSFDVDGGRNGYKLKGGLPTIFNLRDLTIQGVRTILVDRVWPLWHLHF